MRQAVYRMSGVDLTVIEGIEAYTALVIFSELGTDLKKHFPTENQFASWLTLCPGTNKTGGKQKNSRTRRSANRVSAALRLAANSLHHSQTALGAYFRRMKVHIGKPEAVTATAHKLARLIYKMLAEGMEYVQRGQDEYEERYRKRVIRNLKRRAKQLGYELVAVADSDAMAG
jgi:transposase